MLFAMAAQNKGRPDWRFEDAVKEGDKKIARGAMSRRLLRMPGVPKAMKEEAQRFKKDQ